MICVVDNLDPSKENNQKICFKRIGFYHNLSIVIFLKENILEKNIRKCFAFLHVYKFASSVKSLANVYWTLLAYQFKS